jgi:hypothetical protein
MGDLLAQIPLYKWLIPRDKACFFPSCNHILTETVKQHLQTAHHRKRPVVIGDVVKDARPKIHNGECALQTTTAELLNVLAVGDSRANYSNP